MPETWVERGARERAEQIAAFVAGHARHDMTALPVGVIARLVGCPVRPPDETRCLHEAAESERLGYPDDRDYHLRQAALDVGSEARRRRVTQALTAAFKHGLIARTRRGRGPWRYYVPASNEEPVL